MTTQTMTPEQAFKKYGMVESNGLWAKRRGAGVALDSERWMKTDGGWLCFRSPGRGSFGAVPFGWPVASLLIGQTPEIITGSEDGQIVKSTAPSPVVGYVQVPWRQTDEFAQVSGLHPASHPQSFEWIWPDAEVAHVYQYAEEGWIKIQDYDSTGVPSGSHMERDPEYKP